MSDATSNSKKNEKKPTLRFFTPSKLLLLLEYNEDFTADDLRKKLKEVIVSSDVPFQERLLAALDDKERVVINSFDIPNHPEDREKLAGPERFEDERLEGDVPNFFATVTLNLQIAGEEPLSSMDLMEIIDAINDPLEQNHDKHPKKYQKDGGEDERIQVKRLQWNFDGADIFLQGVTFDFLLTSADDQMGAGGPGGKPIPETGSQPDEEDYQFSFPNDDTLNAGTGEGATVFVLDTAHNCERFAEIQAQGLNKNHPLLQNLLTNPPNPDCEADNFSLGENFKVTLQNGLPDDDPNKDRYLVPGHDYDMSDHGLFIAGMIRTIASDAKIHLVQVLNKYGVGSIGSIINGFRTAMRVADGHPTIFNMSFTMVTPIDGYDIRELKNTEIKNGDWKDLKEAWKTWKRILKHNRSLDVASLILQYLCEHASRKGITLVAAAGNEGQGGTPPRPRFPALAKPVIGVGAIKRDNSPTQYSNKADSPLSDGIATLGGGIDVNDFANKKSNSDPGILGIFTADTFPDGTSNDPNSNLYWGWTRWSGTSFAAPIVSAVMAILQADRGMDMQGAQQAIRAMKPSESSNSAAILEVTQG